VEPHRRTVLLGLSMGIIAVILIFGAFGAGYVLGRARAEAGPGIASALEDAARSAFGSTIHDHGAIGLIVSVTDHSVTVRTRDGRAREVMINDQTMIDRDGNRLKLSDLKTGDVIIVAGSPNTQRNALDARLVRVVEFGTPVGPSGLREGSGNPWDQQQYKATPGIPT
jgi:hypothetical protein